MSAAIEVRDLTKRYGAIKALDSICLTVNQGELFGLIGPDGSGKSTLYRILASLTAPDSGEARICGLDTVRDTKLLRSRIGYMPERFSLYADMTVSENLCFFASLYGVSAHDSHELIAPVFGQLAKFPDRKAGALSGGMKQKLALSCALIHRPSVLLLDEPTTGVDAVSRSEFWDMLSVLRDGGMTILVSTSYMDEASRCQRVAMVNGGRVLATDTPSDLVKGVGENLYNAEAGDMFRLLSILRSMPEVAHGYTFGATLHVVAAASFNSLAVMRHLAAEGISDARIYPAHATIEDLFIKLTRDADARAGN